MKKLLSIVLATLMLVSCLSVTAFAETDTEATDYVKMFADYGINVDHARYLGNAGEFELYDAGSQEIMNMVYEVPIGDYRFYSLGQFRPYDLGLFVRNADEIYTLGSAYEDGIINDGDMDAIYSVLRNEENRKKHFYWRVVKQGDATNEEQLFIQYQKDNNLYLFGPGEGDYLFKKLGEYKGYSLCFGYSHLSPMDWTFEIDAYKVYVRACCESLYLINDTQVIPVTVARDTGLIDDVEEFIYILNYNYYNYFEVVDTSVATTQRFCDSVNEYLRQLGMENDYPELTPENVYTSDWIEFYREDEFTVIFGIKGKTNTPAKEYIREYTFNADTYFHESNPCGYCYYSGNAGVVALQDTHKNNQTEMAKYIPGTLFEDKTNVYYVIKKYLEERNALNEHNSSFYLAVLGEVGEYTLCYGSGNMLYPEPTTVKIGNYNFTVKKLEMFSDYPLNLYLVKNGEVIPFDQTAYENNIISDEDVETAVQLIKTSDATVVNDWTVTNANGTDVVVDPYLKNNTQVLKNAFAGVDFDIVKLGRLQNNKYTLYYNTGAKLTEGNYSRYSNGYKFKINQKQEGFDLGLYLVSSSYEGYTLEDVVENGYVNMDDAYELIANSGLEYTFEITKDTTFEQDEQRYIQYLKDNDLFVYGPENKDEYAFVNLGEIDGYRFYYGYSERITGVGTDEIIVGDYAVTTYSSVSDFYFINDEEIISCVNNKDMDRDTQEKICNSIDEYLTRHPRGGYRYISGYKYAYPYLNKAFIDELNNYIISLGYGDFFFGEDNTLFNQDNIKTSDKIKILHQARNFAVIQLIGPDTLPATEEYTNYTFISDTFFHESNPCGYFILESNWRDEVEMITLASAIEEYNDSTDGEIYYSYYLPHINHKPENIQKAEKLMQQRYGNKIYSMKHLLNDGDVELYYNENEPVYEWIDGYYTKIIGNYEFSQYGWGGDFYLGLYVVSEDTLYTLAEAYDAGVFTNLDALYEYDLNNDDVNFSMTKMEDAKYKMYTHLTQLGVNFKMDFYDCVIIDYVNFGTIDGYTVCAGGSQFGYSQTLKIGDYVLVVPKTYEVCTAGLWIADENGIYELEQAYTDGRINDEQLAEICNVINSHEDYTAEKYDDIQINDPYIEMSTNKLEAGQKVKMITVKSAGDKKVTFKSENPDTAKVNQNGAVTGLKKGKATITITVGDKTFTRKVKVTTNPKLEKKTVTVKKNKVVKVKLTGKVKNIKNVYTNTKKAQIISVRKATKLKIKGLKKGATTLKIKVNGVKTLKLKVKIL